MDERNQIIKYLIDQYLQGNIEEASNLTGYTQQQLNQWTTGERTPQRQTIDYLIHKIFVPEFKVIVEFGEIDSAGDIRSQLRSLLAGHETNSGIYAFYDGMANLLYVGKATNLLDECYQTIRRDVPVNFPAGIKKKPEKRYEVVKYISAYDVGASNWVDYPKHVESLILRISKPILNKQIGFLERAYSEPTES